MRTYKNYRYLLSFAFILAITSCGKTIHDYAVWGEFRYYNKTASNILLKLDGPISGAAHKVYSIAPNDSLVLKTSGETNEKYAESWGYRPPVGINKMKQGVVAIPPGYYILINTGIFGKTPNITFRVALQCFTNGIKRSKADCL